MNPPHKLMVPEYLDENVVLGGDPDGYRFGRSRLVKGARTGKPYLVRRGLLNGVGEHLYYRFATARDIAVRPVQFLRAGGRVRNMVAVWWADGGAVPETAGSGTDTANPLDIPRSMALDLFLDNFNPFSGWMFEGGRVYRLFNHQTLGLGSGPVPLLTRYRLIMGGGIHPVMDLGISFEALRDGERNAFLEEARVLAELPDEALWELCRVPDDVGIGAFRACAEAMGDGPGSREVRKLLFRRGGAFLHEYAFHYCLARRRELRLQLRLGRRA